MLSNADIARVIAAALGAAGMACGDEGELVEFVHELREPTGDVDMAAPFGSEAAFRVATAIAEACLAIDGAMEADLDGPRTEVRNGALAYALQHCHAGNSGERPAAGAVTEVAAEFEKYLIGGAS